MSHVLDRILAQKRDEVSALRAARSADAWRDAALREPPPRGFLKALRARNDGGFAALIAECKARSPSAGEITADYDPARLARAYEAGGAACLSVLTDGPAFGGALSHLRAARATTGVPALRKDFMVDPIQVFEGRGAGADAILVILAAVDDALARDLIQAAADCGMDALVEVHDQAELNRAAALEARLIGVNNRDLKTFVTDLAVTERLADHTPPNALLVAESGLASTHDARRLARAGARAFLIGQTLAGAADSQEATRMFASVPLDGTTGTV